MTTAQAADGSDAPPDGARHGPPRSPLRNRFPRERRITHRSDFDRILKHGARMVDSRLTLWALSNGTATTRLGLIVGRKHGNAVQRNRIKRVVREAFRLSQHELPAGLDLVCAPRAGVEIDPDTCRQSLARLSERLARRLENQR